MWVIKSQELSRRAFLERSASLAIAGTASSFALGLTGISEAAALATNGDYKALVCIFLYGGNDHANTLIPFDANNYGKYASIRQGVALAREQLSGTLLRQPDEQILTNDVNFALSPSMPRMHRLFGENKLGVLLNVGPLEAPITRAQFESGNTRSFPRPAKLFSHNDQQSTWQSSGVEGTPTGWGGRLGDLAQSANSNAMFTAINVTGNAVFLTGRSTIPFKISKRGPVEFVPVKSGTLFRSTAVSDALQSVMRTHHQHILEQDYAATVSRALANTPFVSEVLSGSSSVPGAIAGNSLSEQLETVAKLIEARDALGVTRQVFMVSLGGFDHHSNLIGPHEELLSQLDSAVDQFYRTTERLGVSDQVTTFTASDFGRTLTPNGNGSDHGWGGHHFIIGGAVKGGQFYGTAPSVSTRTDDQVGRGRLLPSTSVDEYSATLARWFGVADSELSSIAPNIGRFGQPNLGFMKEPPQA
ncbi:Tat pathway signal protein [Erythrobacter sp. KY5]|uniref:DUF1501 domain-containing protein n=1 Tax=Erythrobacter sp. KY5 TaxID=2011159 RepID=UPI000DBF28ED|nr:DUF1501 domain-containing protein [Erythrobacter sp. KY5]AWW75427.1 Tat pathway signal protein [Erythrobacter sp. KY5]